MKIYDTQTMNLSSETEKLWAYNGLDCCLTHEIFSVLEPQLDEHTRETYAFSKALQAPILEMNMRGVLIDQVKRYELIKTYRAELIHLGAQLDRILDEGLGCSGLNWRSNQQLISLFYGQLGIPEIRKRNAKGEMAPTVNREALEKLKNYFTALPLVSHLLKMRDQAKRIGTLETEIDPDGRIRTAYNIAGTTTGRFSSAFSDFGTGGNLQNIEQRLRRIFIADPGYKFANIDLKSGDSFGVGCVLYNLFDNDAYLAACETGDIHTSVARMTWHELPWTGDIKQDKILAESTIGYRDLSVRDLSKKLGHGTNYYGKPHTMSKHTKVEIDTIKDFQNRYFAAFPLQRWHGHVQSELLTRGFLVSLLGRKRWFFGRRNDDSTLREAIAYDPQSTTSDVLNRGLLEVWRQGLCQLLLQVHDSILVQYPERDEDTIIPKLLAATRQPITLRGGRVVTIPMDVKVGWNWAYANADNPDGLKDYKGEKDVRQRQAATTILDRGF
jgi:DNA polymerase-1